MYEHFEEIPLDKIDTLVTGPICCRISPLKVMMHRRVQEHATHLGVCVGCRALGIQIWSPDDTHTSHPRAVSEHWEIDTHTQVPVTLITGTEVTCVECTHCHREKFVLLDKLEGSFVQPCVVVELEDVGVPGVERPTWEQPDSNDSDSDTGVQTSVSAVRDTSSSVLTAVFPEDLWETVNITAELSLYGQLEFLRISKAGRAKYKIILKVLGHMEIEPCLKGPLLTLEDAVQELSLLPALASTHPAYVSFIVTCLLTPRVVSGRVRALLIDVNEAVLAFLTDVCGGV
eukprot:Blabericola_migrator_1__3547@NODE_2052_length_3356_cov_89_705990_g1302_i0_p2_GENE_NODE_2052_length_3356_cov_89_705990_g1302_i0NODE_2052_length_3356_cov_89_705990_g1302_i0_p2_ORF_typecomplete_len287_score86_82zfPHDlike/PF15446_6/0_018DUF3716/PF12511_8/8_6e03DUF3716/PF12511_8/0_037_NODE_2052_length_3356_cov_89_705990_g1302_i04451305